MDVREKLVEQLREVAGLTPPICEYQEPEEIELFGKKVTVYCKPFEQFQELLREAADYIDHGVTVQEWISVKDERKPKCGEDVLVVVFDGYDTYTDADCLMRDGKWCFETENHKVTHWQPMPQPPKGE